MGKLQLKAPFQALSLEVTVRYLDAWRSQLPGAETAWVHMEVGDSRAHPFLVRVSQEE